MLGLNSILKNVIGNEPPTPETLAKLVKPLLAQMGNGSENLGGFIIEFGKNEKGEDILKMEACQNPPINEIKKLKQKAELLKMICEIGLNETIDDKTIIKRLEEFKEVYNLLN